jgi:hypothetical protein
MLSVLHLVQDPTETLRSFKEILSKDSQVILTVPNLSRLPVVVGRMRRDKRYVGLGSYGKTGVHVTSKRIVRKWISAAGLKVEKCVEVLPRPGRGANRASFGMANSLFATEFIVAARRP